ncbi:hypothetical protein D1AOALGA4SA_3929 [Olavius algarvensis Delta 1 endosymbiont]|nr:hypothetical protein D1AOALGA4SA_3929 [Olavius algarvensis Delta 1 endosymbiont]
MESKFILNSISIGGLFFAAIIVFWFVFVYLKKRVKSDQLKQGYATTVQYSGAEKRRHKRAEISWPAVLEKSDPGLNVQLMDISLGGAFVICPEPLGLKDQFRITIDTPAHGPLQLNAEVVWSNVNMPSDQVVNRGMGIRFINNEGNERETLQQAIAAALDKIDDSIEKQP